MQPRSGPRRVTAFAGVDAQKDALDAWRAKTSERAASVTVLSTRVAGHKKQAERTAERIAWIADREALNKERDVCEEQLARALHPLLGCFREDVVTETSQTQRLRDTIRDALLPVKGSLQALARATSSTTTAKMEDGEKPSDILAVARAQVAAARAALEDARLALEKEARLDEEAGRDGPAAALLHSSTVDFAALYDTVEQRRALLAEHYAAGSGPSTAILAAFAQALASERDRCADRLDELRAETMTTLPQAPVDSAVLSSVALILKTARNARRAGTGGPAVPATREVATRVSRAFPKMSRAEVDAAIDACQQARRRTEQERFIAAEYRKSTAALLDACEAALRAETRAQLTAAEVEQERAKRAQVQALRGERLAELRAAHADVLRLRQAEAARAQAAEEAKQAAAAAARMAEMQVRMDQLAEFMRVRAETQRREAEVAAMRAAEEAEQRAAQAELNKERVAFRHRAFEERQAQRREREQELAAMQEAKSQALERFFAAVDRDLGVQPSRERLLQATEALKQTTSYVPIAQRVSGAPRGYTDDQIMQDPRVRLYHALMEAGLHKTSYGREVASRGFHVAPAQRTSEDSPFF